MTHSDGDVAGLVLAAGFSRRYGSDKRHTLQADNLTLLAASLRVPCGVLAEVWVVLRPEDDAVALGLPATVRLARNPQAERGMGNSLACGVRALAGQSAAQAVAIFLGDMPWLEASTLETLLAEAGPGRIVVPTHLGTAGHPVIFGRRFWPALMELDGDLGARAVVQANDDAVLRVAVDDPGILRDVDTPSRE